MIVDGIKRHIGRITPDFVREVFRRNPLVINLCSPEMLYELIQTLCSGTYDDKVWPREAARSLWGADGKQQKKAGGCPSGARAEEWSRTEESYESDRGRGPLAHQRPVSASAQDGCEAQDLLF